jgi:hypothetical protein
MTRSVRPGIQRSQTDIEIPGSRYRRERFAFVACAPSDAQLRIGE